MATEEQAGHQPQKGSLGARVGLSALIAIVALNVWTGSPLLALWIGSRVQGTGPPSMAAVFLFIALFALFSISLFQLLKVLGRTYDEVTGQPQGVRQHHPWLRSMRGEREQYADVPLRLTMLERILVGMVVVVFVLFEIWFFFFSSSPIDQRSGRAAAEPPSALASSGSGGQIADRLLVE